MSRVSSDELAEDGTILNGYDYSLQTWVLDGIIQDAGNCPQYVGEQVRDVPDHEVRPAPCHTTHCRHYGLPHGRPCEVEVERIRQGGAA